MTIPAVFNFPAASTTAVCIAQVRTGSGSLVINGTLANVSDPPGNAPFIAIFPGIQRTVTLTSGGNVSGVTFTITGVDTRNVVVTESLAGPSGNTVMTTAEFHKVTSVTVNGTVGTATSIGTGATGSTRWFTGDIWTNPFQMTLQVEIAATASVTVQTTADDVNTDASPVTFDHPVLAAITSSNLSNWAFSSRFTRAVMNSSSGSGAFVFTIIQSGN